MTSNIPGNSGELQMKATTGEVVFVLDSCESMRPCFEGLARNLDQVLGQMAKSISGTSLQGAEEHYAKALFG